MWPGVKALPAVHAAPERPLTAALGERKLMRELVRRRAGYDVHRGSQDKAGFGWSGPRDIEPADKRATRGPHRPDGVERVTPEAIVIRREAGRPQPVPVSLPCAHRERCSHACATGSASAVRGARPRSSATSPAPAADRGA